MTAFLDRLSSAPVASEEFSFDFESWISILVDTMNETLQDIENLFFVKQEIIAPTTTLLVEINSTYISGNDALTTFTLPIDAPQGAVVRIIGKGVAGWTLLPAAGQTIEVSGTGSASTSVSSTGRYDCITIEVVTTNTTWVTTSSETAGFAIV